MSYISKISNEELAALPDAKHNGEIIVVDTSDHVEAIEYLSRCDILGFDTETRPSFKKGVSYPISLLQLTGEGRTYLFRVDRIKLSNGIVKLLRSNKVVKVGVDINEDIRKLRNIVAFTPNGFIDLQKFAPQYGIEDKSLKKLTAIVLGKRLSKAQRLTNWSAKQLTSSQIMYAATDSYITREIYLALIKESTNL